MEINDLKIFESIVRFNSTIKAADSLGYVQSNISKRLTKLEEELGKTLFYRTNKGMVLTEDGEQFLRYVDTLLATISDMETNFLGNKSKIRLGATQTITKNYLRQYFFNNEWLIFTDTAMNLLEQLKSQKLDMVLLNKKIADTELKETEFTEESIFWLYSKEIQPSFHQQTVLINRDKECPYRKATLAYLEEHHLTDMPIIEVDTLDVLLDMLQEHDAIAILPKETVRLNASLKIFETSLLPPVKIYSYQLKSSEINLTLER
ncbi:LysR family transcriptional regulator [Candidatus Enterococcus murrayae]|uniref:LysR family transcriptional regulator n=1 Tax=Candidatus Enterococcus murrayae TaxID=2815321 RepID=A0ABS3HJX1_9ENTE|nr:LysR family transcriptional regulator [Enterococcus sp. MJM16]MBO0453756.1 LysR family transcriptional regulator [Enterococcus sp. MJM16]